MIFVTILAQTSILLAVALIAGRLIKSPVARTAIGRAALLGALVLAIVAPLTAGRFRPVLALPSESSSVSEFNVPPRTETPGSPTSIPDANVAQISQTVALPSESLAPPAPASPAAVVDRPLKVSVFGVWAVGVLVGLLSMFAGHLGLTRLYRRSTRLLDGPAVEVLGELAGPTLPELRESSNIGAPFLCGLRKPAILLPKGLVDEALLRPVLAHEVCHLERRDVPWSYAGRGIQAVLWFQPLVWFIRKEIVAASEEACDAEALRQGCAPTAYADCLLRLATNRQLGLGASLTAGISSSRSRLSSRVEAILNNSLRFANRLSLRARFGIGIASIVVMALGGVLVAPAFAGPEKGQSTIANEDAKTVWAQTVETYRNLRSISFTESESGGIGHTLSKILFVPNRQLSALVFRSVDGSGGPLRYVYDGRNRLLLSYSPPATYLKGPCPQGTVVGSRDTDSSQFANPLLEMFYGPDQANLQKLYANEATVAKQGKLIDGTQTVCLETSRPGPNRIETFKIFIGQRDHLVREISHTFGGSGNLIEQTFTFRSVRANPKIEKGSFAIAIPKGATEVHEPRKPVNSKEALALVGEMARASVAVRSLTANVETSHTQGASKWVAQRNFAFQWPSSARSDLRIGKDRFHAVTDGQKALVQNLGDPQRYFLSSTATKSTSGPLNDVFDTGGYRTPISGQYPMVELSLCGVPCFGNLPTTQLKLGGRKVFEGEAVDELESRSPILNLIAADTGDEQVQRFYVSQRDHLVRFVETRLSIRQPSGVVETIVLQSTVRNLRLNPPLPDSTFAVNVPAGASAIPPRDPNARLWYEPNLATEVGNSAPDLKGTLTDGRAFSLADRRGKVVILYAWTNGVIDRPGNVAALVDLQRKFRGKGLEVIGLAVGLNRESASSRAKELGFNFPSLLDGPSMKAWNIHLLPLELVIDQSGRVQGKNLEPVGRNLLVRSLLANH